MKTWKFHFPKGLVALIFTFAAVAATAGQVTFPNATGFGQVTLGTSKTISFSVKNTGTSQVRLDSNWFNTNLTYAVVGGTCKYDQSTGFIVGAGSSCAVDIKFTPTISGTQNDTWILGYYPGTSWTWTESALSLTGSGATSTTATLPPPPTTTTTTTTNTPAGWLKVVGNKIVDSNGLQVVLKGVNIADAEVLDNKPWERPNVTAKIVADMATDQYFAEVVRIPVLPGVSTSTEGFFSSTNGWDKYFNNHLLPLVNDITSKGKYAIIDLHYIRDYGALWSNVQSFWKFMAPKFANNSHVLYEIFNEPINPDNWSTWKTTIAQPAVNLIRSYAPNNIILVGGPYWSSHMSGAATDPVAGTNLVYVGHVYSNQSSKTIWDSRYLPVIQKFPMFFTEWGFETGGTEGGDINFGKAFESWMRSYNASWTAWNFDPLWGPRMVNSDWSLKASPGGEGTFIRDLLIEEHNK